jgi:hypothetical protein
VQGPFSFDPLNFPRSNLSDLCMQEWLAIAKITANKKKENSEIKEYYWITFAEDDLFDLWKQVCDLWVKGKLIDQNGKKGTKRTAKGINPTVFSCFEGDISPEEIIEILKRVKSGEVYLKKHHANTDGKLSMEELAYTCKVQKRLKKEIIAFFERTYSADFLPPADWERVCAVLPKFKEAKVLERLVKVAGRQYQSELLKQNVPDPMMPVTLQQELEKIYDTQFGNLKRNQNVPFEIFHTEYLGRDVHAPREVYPEVKLAIVDFGRDETPHYPMHKIKELFKHFLNLKLAPFFVTIFFLRDPSMLPEIMSAVQAVCEETGMEARYEWGNYARDVAKKPAQGQFYCQGSELIAAVGITGLMHPDWSQCFKSQSAGNRHLEYSSVDSKLEEWDEPASRPHGGEEEDKWIAKYMLQCPPRYEFVHPGRQGLVNPRVKPLKMLRQLILRFTEPGNTVLDIFSGGMVMKLALMAEREVFCYTDNAVERAFVEKYVGELSRKVEAIKIWFKKLKQQINQGI